jgi:exonuclease VII small subunit
MTYTFYAKTMTQGVIKMAEQKFEEALNKLEQIVDDLESGSLGLDEAGGFGDATL